jgi:hypothetical protein
MPLTGTTITCVETLQVGVAIVPGSGLDFNPIAEALDQVKAWDPESTTTVGAGRLGVNEVGTDGVAGANVDGVGAGGTPCADVTAAAGVDISANRSASIGVNTHGCTVRVFRQKFTLEDVIGCHACSLEANTRVTNDIPLGSSLFLPVDTVNCVQTLKVYSQALLLLITMV